MNSPPPPTDPFPPSERDDHARVLRAVVLCPWRAVTPAAYPFLCLRRQTPATYAVCSRCPVRPTPKD